jgi:hypothetical protein
MLRKGPIRNAEWRHYSGNLGNCQEKARKVLIIDPLRPPDLPGVTSHPAADSWVLSLDFGGPVKKERQRRRIAFLHFRED